MLNADSNFVANPLEIVTWLLLTAYTGTRHCLIQQYSPTPTSYCLATLHTLQTDRQHADSRLKAAGICNLQTVVSCRFHGSRWQPTEGSRVLNMLVHLFQTLGTVCMQTLSVAVHIVYLLSDVT